MGKQTPLRLPLIVAPENRDATLQKDAKLLNGYIEKDGSETWVVKRPGFSIYLSTGYVAAGSARGVVYWNNGVYSVWNGFLYGGTTLQSSGVIDFTGPVFRFSALQTITPHLFFHDYGYAYNFDFINNVYLIRSATSPAYSGDSTNGFPQIINLTPSLGASYLVGPLQPGDPVSGMGLPAGVTIISIDSATQITVSANATATAVGTNFTFQAYGWPGHAVQGSVYIDGTMYTANSAAQIIGSDLNNTLTWNPLNLIVAGIDSSNVIAIEKQLVYLCVFKQFSVEMFYDAGNALGSPLAPVQGAKLSIGLASAVSLREIGGIIFWVSMTDKGGLGVMKMENLKAEPIETPAILRILEQSGLPTHSWVARYQGHTFYGLTSITANYTIVYDMSTQQWSQWTDTQGNYLPFADSTSDGAGRTLFQGMSDGNLYEFNPVGYDWNGAVQLDLYTPIFDGGGYTRKYLAMLNVVADQGAGNILNVRFSDDDYRTWSNFRDVDLSGQLPFMTNCGTFTQRAFHFRCKSTLPLRLRAIELKLEIGSI